MTKEVAVDRSQEEETQAKEDLPEDYSATLMVKVPSFVPGIAPTKKTSSSSSRHYTKLLLLGLSNCQWELRPWTS